MRHQNKHIEAALQYAKERGWRVVKSGPRAHAWGRIFCPANERGGCMYGIFSTPVDPQDHAARIVRKVNNCPHS